MDGPQYQRMWLPSRTLISPKLKTNIAILNIAFWNVLISIFFQTRSDTPLLVNIKGCGYPPEISCPAFANHYNEISQRNQTFPCYYSQENPWIVLQSYDFR